MRQTYIVSYDVSDDKRLRKVFKTLRGWGDHLQYSVFRCELNARELVELRDTLSGIIHHKQDQVMFVDVGPAEGRGANAFSAIGRPYLYPENNAVVV
jgi:CRISPR-associated protein Cas2